jgi:hypothetical protein
MTGLPRSGIAEEYDHQHEERRHHEANRLLQTALDAAGDDEDGQRHEQGVAQTDRPPVAHETAELGADGAGIRTGEHAHRALHDVRESPAGDDAVVRQDEDTRDYAHAADQLPASRTALFFAEQAHCRHRVAAAAATDEDLRHHHRHTDEEYAQQVDDDECATTILAGNVGEFPDVAEADGGAGDGQDEGES